MDRPLGAIGAGHAGLHRDGIFGAKIKDLSDLDATGVQALVDRHLALEATGIVHIGGCRIEAGPRLDQQRKVTVIVDVLARNRQIEHVPIAEHCGLAGLRQDDELV